MLIGMLPVPVTVPQASAYAEQQEPTCEDGFGSPVCVFLHPGIGDSYKPGWSHTLDTLWDTQAGDGGQTRQLFDRYLNYAILASGSDSIGDLQFDIQVLEPIRQIDVYAPPEFKWLIPTSPSWRATGEGVWTDITNDYKFIDARVRSVYDQIAPNWVRVRIGPDRDSPRSIGDSIMIEPGTYHIRLFDFAAPEVAGLYHFKIYVDGVSIGAGNFPIIIVKDELNPAWIAATVRTNLGFTPPYVSGRVAAEGTTPEGRSVSAVGYFGPNEWLGDSFVPGQTGAQYRTYLFGVAEGSYDLKAEASGYAPTTSERITVLAGQSYHIGPIVLFDSPDVHVTVWSKHGTGELPWHNLWQLPYGTNNPTADPDDTGPRRDILLELYDSSNTMVAFWASNALAAYGDTKSIPATAKLIGLHDDAPGGTIPMATSYNAQLVDNYDLLGNPRGYPSTIWDGHVPWDTADYISGLTNAQYTVEAFVTGYIMDESDAYQRTFSLSGSSYQLQLDLRRSNWIETTMHMPSGVFLSGETSVTLIAEDASGNERAGAAFLATTDMSLDGQLNGPDLTDGEYAGGIVIEGWNVLFPNVAGEIDDIKMKDYGLNPAASTHSAGAVSLAGNPYTVKLYMADMGAPYEGVLGTGWYNIVGGDPQVSVFLCNSPQSISFSVVNAWVQISLRSVDFQVPAHSRPWTFPGSEIRLGFTDTATGRSTDPYWTIIYGLVQDTGTVDGTGFDILGNPFGADGVTPFDIDNINEEGRHGQLAVRYSGIDLCRPGIIGAGKEIYNALIPWYRSTRLPAGEYTYTAYTHGYVMRRSFPVQIPLAGGADIEADLIQGGQIRVTMEFKHEAVATNFNGFVRVEVFNADNELVGASIYGQAEPNIFSRATEGGGYLGYDEAKDWMLASIYGYTPSGMPEPAQAAGFDENYGAYPSASRAQRARYSSLLYGVPANTWAGWPATGPADANRPLVPAGQRQAFDVYGFYWYYGDAAQTWAGGWPTTSGTIPYTGGASYVDYGLRGSTEIPGWSGSGGGLYKVKVWAFDPYGPNGLFDSAAPSDDWRMYQMAWPLENVEVPWGGSVELFVTMNNMATLRGTVSWLDMFGNVRALPWAQVTASPGPSTDSIPAYAAGLGAVGAGASDPAGAYIMWLPAGSHDVSVSTSEAPQVWSSSAPTIDAAHTVVVSDGWVGSHDTRLSYSEGVPVPEFSSAPLPIGILAIIAVAVLLLLRRTVIKRF
jgi:hypothetical protein